MSSDHQTATLTEDDVAIRSVPERITAAWATNDATAFADVFAEDGLMILPGDVHLTSREQIRSFMHAGFSGPYKGTRVTGKPLSFRRLSPDVGVLITEGGVLAPGETEVSAQQAIRGTWVVSKQGQDWLLSAYHNSPINQP